VEGTAKIEGLEAAMKAMQAAFPAEPKKQRQILNGAMGASARKSMVPIAKQLALAGDGSGALSEAIAVRNMSARTLRKVRSSAGVQITPVRANRKAMMMYIAYYYTSRGRVPHADMINSGIRHGHLVEFGSVHNQPQPFLYPAATAGKGSYIRGFSAEMTKKTEAAVRRAARKK
jgi:hypothetical protein